MDETTRRRPALLREHRCEHPTDSKVGDRFQCYCGRTWRATAQAYGRRWVLDGGA